MSEIYTMHFYYMHFKYSITRLKQDRSLFSHKVKALADMAVVLYKVIRNPASFSLVVCLPLASQMAHNHIYKFYLVVKKKEQRKDISLSLKGITGDRGYVCSCAIVQYKNPPSLKADKESLDDCVFGTVRRQNKDKFTIYLNFSLTIGYVCMCVMLYMCACIHIYIFREPSSIILSLKLIKIKTIHLLC